MDNDFLEEGLESNKRNHKVIITDIAISKVPFIKYREISEDCYETLREICRMVLRMAKNDNDSNEVAITYDLESPKIEEADGLYLGVSCGDEHSVDPLRGTEAFHIYSSARSCVVVISHNHPSLSKVSLEDAEFLLLHQAIKMVIAVTNRGNITYLVKSDAYDRKAAIVLLKSAIEKSNHAQSLKEKQEACDFFLNRCFTVGLVYDDH